MFQRMFLPTTFLEELEQKSAPQLPGFLVDDTPKDLWSLLQCDA